MKDKSFLMIPGPTPIPESVLLAMAKHPIGHRSSEFSAILEETYADLKWLFQTQNDVFIYTSSGTGAMEAALSNLVNEGDKVLSLVIGNFGNRWAKIAASLGADVEKIEVPAGQAIDPAALKQRLEADVNKEIKIVTLTHNETATGVTNPLKELVALIKEHGAVSVVDGVTSVGAIECKMDEWGIDVLISGSQKGFMIPPGLAFLAASEKAFKMHEQCKHPSFYFDWSAYRKSVRANSTPYTPAVNLIVALNEALKMMKKDGLENILARHEKHAKALREGITVPDIRSTLKKDFDIVVANGQNELKDKIFRMGTLGFVCDRDVLAAVASLEASLYKLGYKFELGSGVKAAIENLV